MLIQLVSRCRGCYTRVWHLCHNSTYILQPALSNFSRNDKRKDYSVETARFWMLCSFFYGLCGEIYVSRVAWGETNCNHLVPSTAIARRVGRQMPLVRVSFAYIAHQKWIFVNYKVSCTQSGASPAQIGACRRAGFTKFTQLHVVTS